MRRKLYNALTRSHPGIARGSGRSSTFLIAAILAVLTLTSSVYSQQCAGQSRDDMIAWWPMDETEGTTVNDTAGSNSGVIVNGAQHALGMVGNCLRFDGINDYVSVPDSPVWAFGLRDFTIELWANFDQPGSGSVGRPGDVFIGNDERGGTYNKWFFALGGGFLNFHINGPGIGAQFFPLVPFSPVVGQWYHLAVRRSGNTYSIFVDGQIKGSAVNSYAVPNANAPLTIGQAEGLGYMNGRLDEITVYKRALSNDELTEIYSAGSAGKCERPVVDCPPIPIEVTTSSLGQICIPLHIRNTDSVSCTVGNWYNDTLCFHADSLGSYQITAVAIDTASDQADTCTFWVNVSGVKVGDETVTPGHTVKVPIRLLASDSLLGFTIPLKFTTKQPSKVHLDSVQVDTAFGGSAIIVGPDSSEFVDCRPVQRPPLPPDTLNPYVVAYACFRVDSDAVAEVIPIDTTTIVYNATTYSYKFYDVDTTAFVPLFVPGSLTIKDTGCVAPFVCGDFDSSCQIDVSDVIYLVNYIFANGPAPADISHGNVNSDSLSRVDVSDAVYMVNYIFGNGCAPCVVCPDTIRLGKAMCGDAEVWVEKNVAGDGTSLMVHIKSDVEVRGVQLEFESPATGDFKAAGLVEGMTTLSGHKDNLFKAGLLDLSGTKAIPAGETAVMRLQTGSTDEITIVNAILVGQDARPLNVVVKEMATSPALPKQYALAQNYPNPFNPSTAINFSLPKPSPVRLEVFNTLGQRVITLMDQFCAAGNYTVNWEGANDRGESVASGVYFYRLRADEFIKTRQMVLLK